MAEEKRSINIAYKADLKDLINKLKQMPNVTEAEAKKMVAALDRQLKQAEKAAQKSADASAKAAKNAAAAARRGSKEFDDMADAARRAEERLERVGEASGDID
jgi:methyl-accepting chemotaxis protein